ncbi:MAG: RNA methyltransferase [Clostridiales bacterium]|nr:RNA methyltransferase [Clostridiales bacterium]MDY5468081.1 RNA methyltransferase [Eubacteriales bacterium]
MADIVEITDFSAPELDVYARLTGAQLRACPQGGLFIAEGVTVIGHALDAGYRIASLLMERRHIVGKAAGLIARCGDVPVYTADSRTLEQLTGFALTRGVLAAFYRPELPTLAQVCAGARRVAVLEGLNDPTNVGAVMRSAAALGMDAVLLTPSCCDPLYRRAVRVSMGTVFQVPWTRIGQQAQDWPEGGMTLLREMGFATVAMALSEDSVEIDDPCLVREERLAVILGAEGDGLAKTTIARCDYTARIPMLHGVDSLNVAAASAVAFWQLCRRNNK